MAKPTFKTLDYLYFHLVGAGNTAYATLVTDKRTYCQTLTAGATTSIQFVQSETLKRLNISSMCAADGTIEVSRSSATQIATAQATSDVLARFAIDISDTGAGEKSIEWA